MKSLLTGIVLLMMVFRADAGTTYTVSVNTSWNGVYPAYCGGCTFNISAGVTLTLNTGATCNSCIFNGGIITLTSDFVFQQVAISGTTVNMGGHKMDMQNGLNSFTNSVVNGTGASNLYSSGNTNPSLTITGSTFNFSGTSVFNNAGGMLNINSSHIYFYGNSSLNVTAGPVNLNNATQMVAGDGTTSSGAFLFFNGPTLNLVDAGSAFYVANKNNYYYNWGNYTSQSNSQSYSTLNNNKNCGGLGQNTCKTQYFYGCASFGNAGYATCIALAVSISDFKASLSGGIVKLSWTIADRSTESRLMVERSTDGVHFIPLANLEAGSYDGQYNYADFSPATGENDYRITLTGPDGNISLSNIISIQNGVSDAIRVYPNPAYGGRFFIQMPGPETASLSIYSMGGSLLYLGSLNGQTIYPISLPQLYNQQLLVIHIVTREKSSSFNLLNIP